MFTSTPTAMELDHLGLLTQSRGGYWIGRGERGLIEIRIGGFAGRPIGYGSSSGSAVRDALTELARNRA